MCEHKVAWKPSDIMENKKKYRVTIRTAHETVRKQYEDAVISCKTRCQYDYNFKEIVFVINGNGVVYVAENFFVY